MISRVKELLRKPKAGSRAAEVESYFEELDQAFAALATVPLAGPATVERSAVPDESSDATAVPARRPPLADAFAALLAAERAGSKSAGLHATPVPLPDSDSLSRDELVERVTRRVLEHLSDAVVRDTVTEIVHATAERLVREEIERIKSNIK
jgi:hypothetical protein